MNKLEISNVDYVYNKSDKIILKDVSASFLEGTVSSIVGESGAGKSTLLYIISGFTKAKAGKISYNGKEVEDLRLYRRNIVSTISQSYMLFPTRTVLENVMYPMLLDKIDKNKAKDKAKELLKSVAIDDIHFDKLPEKLSGGEKQRVAIARALAANSKIIVADEPTGNLDDKNSEEIYSIFDRLAKKDGKIVIIVSHDKDLAKKADYQYEMKDGKLNLL